MPIAFLCAGQGSQFVGMGSDLVADCVDCHATFAAADDAIGYSLTRIMAYGPEDDLRATAVAQPALLTLAVAHARHLAQAGVVPDMLAGHSLGQYAALVIAGSLDFSTAVRLVAERGRLMQECVPEGVGAMAAIVGFDRAAIYAACASVQQIGIVGVACHNSPNQTVISGATDAVAAVVAICEEEGAGVVPLAVSVPTHSQLLTPMIPVFTTLIMETTFVAPRVPVIDNVTARPLSEPDAIRASLIAQIQAPVLFDESLSTMKIAGVTRYIQCGPGNSLLGFARRIDRQAMFETFEQALKITTGT